MGTSQSDLIAEVVNTSSLNSQAAAVGSDFIVSENIKQLKPNYYAIIPSAVRYDENISLLAKLLYSEITALSSKTGECWASNNYFANLYNKSKNHISRVIKELVNNKYIKSTLIKENDRNLVDKRILVLLPIPLIKNGNTPIIKNGNTPIIKNGKENNTSINITSINKELDFFKNKFKHLENENFKSAFKSFVQYRCDIKKPMTLFACELNLKKLNNVNVLTAIEMIENAISSGWSGIYAINKQKKFIKEEQPVRPIPRCNVCRDTLTDGGICYTPGCSNNGKKVNVLADIMNGVHNG